MIQARAWPVRAMYLLIAAALAISLFITAAPAQRVSANSNDVVSEWTRVTAPTTVDWVLAPESTIIDYALASDGEVAYAIVDSDYNTDGDYFLLKSEDSAATWTDITDKLDNVIDPDDENNNYIDELWQVATDWVDPDFVAVAAWWYDWDGGGYYYLNVFFSTDGGTTFNDAGEVEDGGVYFPYTNGAVADLAVSLEAAGKRDIAIGGSDLSGYSLLFRCTVTGDNAGAWVDATAYDGWDDENDGSPFTSIGVTDIIFSPNWDLDKTILVTTVVPNSGYWDIYLQSGSMGLTPGWNAKSTLGIDAVRIVQNENLLSMLISFDPRSVAGMTLPRDYNSKSTDTRVLWVWVNYQTTPDGSNWYAASEIVRVDNDSADPVVQQIKDGKVWVTNVAYYGTIAEGEAIAGLIGTGTDVVAEGCEGVQVYRNTGIHNMDICCERWKKACKPPTGSTAMAVSYVSEDKAYAVALQGVFDYDEGAWSVTFDGGDTWNQLSLVDTDIHYFSDVAVSPDCNKMMLVSISDGKRQYDCDSVWLKATNLPEAEEYSGQWLRTWCGELTGTWPETDSEAGFLRLPMTETTGDTVYLVDYGTDNVYQNDLETLGCWTSVAATTLSDIVDLVATGNSTLYALDFNGDVAIYDDEGWHEAVESKVDHGWSIAVHGDYILVGDRWSGDVSYSDDGGETFTLLEEVTPIDGHITVAFDTYFDTNNTIYAAVEGWTGSSSEGGIYRWVLDESTSWEDMGADNDYGYTGLVLTSASGNTHTSAATGGVLYASYEYWDNGGWDETGVARSLNPAESIACASCVEWDYLDESNPDDMFYGYDSVGFEAVPNALKICGCLTPDSNSKLFAIDSWWDYDIDDGEEGTVWTFEDCYAKKAPNVIVPTGNTTIPADPCSCYNAPFSIKWDGLCDACKYEIQFALDQEFDTAMGTIPVPPEGSKSITSLLVLGGIDGAGLSCETTYYLRVRATEAGTGQEIHSWWSEPLKITIAPSVGQAAITLVSPVPGAQGAAIKNVGFSWNLLATANKFDWVLDDNADLSSPVESKTGLTNAAYTCTKTLSYGTTYYWQVKAYNAGVVISTSAVGTFTTAPTGAFCCPVDGLCFDTEALLKAHTADTHPAQPATPFWVWVVIAIGAVLVIVVIVLIFRTRRV